MQTKIDTISVCDLLDYNFFIPSYQRGYRWESQEITELLEDLNEYAEKIKDRSNTVSNFYCIQPLVVKEKKWFNSNQEVINGYEVIDDSVKFSV